MLAVRVTTRRLAGTVAMLAATGAMAGYAAAQFLPRQYRSSTTIAFRMGVPKDRCDAAAAQTFSDGALRPVILASAYYRTQLDYTPVDEIVGRIQQNGSIHQVKVGSGDGFQVEFTDPDRYAALEMAQVLANEMGHNAGQPTRVAEPISARLTGPGPGMCIICGLGIGATAGLLIVSAAIRC